MKAWERKVLKQRITDLAEAQFGGLLKKIRFSGPFEDEDLDVDIILTQVATFIRNNVRNRVFCWAPPRFRAEMDRFGKH